jgi:uncharacterized protein YcbK (DUF882 family)
MRILFALFILAGGLIASHIPAEARIKPSNRPSTATSCVPKDLQRTLNEVRRKFGPVRVVSTHRPGAKIAGSGRRSLHADCRAVDFTPPAGKYKQVAAWLKANHSGGVGTYSCGMNHIHIDNGSRTRFHRCGRG